MTKTFKQSKIQNFIIPEFSISKGKMVRFWVYLNSQENNSWGIKTETQIIEYLNTEDEFITHCKNRVTRSFIDFVYQPTVKTLFERSTGGFNKHLLDSLSIFEIKPEYRIRDLGIAHQRILTIIHEFQKSETIAFNLMGFAPDTIMHLYEYILIELYKGKSAVCFDNSQFKHNLKEYPNFVDLEIKSS